MAGGKEIDSLQLRKQALILESNLNRLTLEAEWRNLREETAWAQETAETWRLLRPWLPLLAPVLGFLAARGARRPGNNLNRLLSVATWILRLRNVWRSASGPAGDARRDKPAAG